MSTTRLIAILAGMTSIGAVAQVTACGRELAVSATCPDTARSGIVVTVRDSVGGFGLAAGSTLIVRDGTFADSSTRVVSTDILSWDLQRAGTYNLMVRHAGYRDWSVGGVAVLPATCGVQPAQLTARMQPL